MFETQQQFRRKLDGSPNIFRATERTGNGWGTTASKMLIRDGRNSGYRGTPPTRGTPPVTAGVGTPALKDNMSTEEINRWNAAHAPKPETSPRQEGGPVSAGKRYLVGERGPELFMPGLSGQIFPNGLAAALRALAPMATQRIAGFLPPNVGAATAAYITNNSHSSTVHHNNSAETHVGSVIVNTSATDASEIVRDIKPQLERTSFAFIGNYSLA